MKGPIEAAALVALTFAATPQWTSAHDWYMLQGIFMGAALGAILADAPMTARAWRIVASLIIGYMCAGFLSDLFGQTTREGIRFVAGCTSFVGWWIAKALESAAPAAAKKLVKAASDELLNRAAALGLGAGTTDRAADHIPSDRGNKTADDTGNSSDAR